MMVNRRSARVAAFNPGSGRGRCTGGHGAGTTANDGVREHVWKGRIPVPRRLPAPNGPADGGAAGAGVAVTPGHEPPVSRYCL